MTGSKVFGRAGQVSPRGDGSQNRGMDMRQWQEYCITNAPEYVDDVKNHYAETGQLSAGPQKERLALNCYIPVESWHFIRWLAARHGQNLGLVVDRLVMAAKYGIPFHVPDHIPDDVKRGLAYLNARRRLERMAKQMQAGKGVTGGTGSEETFESLCGTGTKCSPDSGGAPSGVPEGQEPEKT